MCEAIILWGAMLEALHTWLHCLSWQAFELSGIIPIFFLDEATVAQRSGVTYWSSHSREVLELGVFLELSKSRNHSLSIGNMTWGGGET